MAKDGSDGKTLVTLLLDRSGSMESARDDTIGALNAYVGGLRASGADIRFSLVLFDSHAEGMALEKVHVARRIAEVPDLKRGDYVPRGSTPLIDAACTTIRAVAESLAGHEGVRSVFAIQTDGAENSSRENSWADLKALVAEKEKAGWEFVFMGCGIDAYAQGERMGLDRDRTMSYRRERNETREAFAAFAESTAEVAAGRSPRFSFSPLQKRRAGDDHDPDRRQGDGRR